MVTDAVLLDLGVWICDGGTGGGRAEQIVLHLIGDSSSSAAVVRVFAQNGSAAAADARQFPAEEDPRQGMTKVFRQEDEEEGIDV